MRTAETSKLRNDDSAGRIPFRPEPGRPNAVMPDEVNPWRGYERIRAGFRRGRQGKQKAECRRFAGRRREAEIKLDHKGEKGTASVAAVPGGREAAAGSIHAPHSVSASLAAAPGAGGGKGRRKNAECRRGNSPIADYGMPVIRSCAEGGRGGQETKGMRLARRQRVRPGWSRSHNSLGCNRLGND